jgi:hypothetical protein
MSTNSLFELLTVYTEVPESVFATSAALSATSKANLGCGIEAAMEGGGVESEAKEAEAMRRPWSRRAESCERWCWRKEEMAATGFVGDEVVEAEVEEAIGAAESGREGGAPGISGSSTAFNFSVLRFCRRHATRQAHGLWALNMDNQTGC